MPHVSTHSVAHDIAAGRSSCFTEWAAAPELPAEDTPSQWVTLEPQHQLSVVSQNRLQQTPLQPLSWGSADRMLAAPETTPRAAASAVFTDGRSSPAWGQAQLLPAQNPGECHLSPVEPAMQEEGSECSLSPAAAAIQLTPSAACLHAPSISAAHEGYLSSPTAAAEGPHSQPWADHPVAQAPGSSAGHLGSDRAASSPSCPPSRHTPGIGGIVGTPYDPLRAARQVFGEGMDVQSYSPALALRGWDGSLRKAFTAWQHLTVALWQARLRTAAPLLRRRRFRCASCLPDFIANWLCVYSGGITCRLSRAAPPLRPRFYKHARSNS